MGAVWSRSAVAVSHRALSVAVCAAWEFKARLVRTVKVVTMGCVFDDG